MWSRSAIPDCSLYIEGAIRQILAEHYGATFDGDHLLFQKALDAVLLGNVVEAQAAIIAAVKVMRRKCDAA